MWADVTLGNERRRGVAKLAWMDNALASDSMIYGLCNMLIAHIVSL